MPYEVANRIEDKEKAKMVAYTLHIYDDHGFPDEKSELQGVVFMSLDNAIYEATEYVKAHLGIVDITEDSDQSDDPVFVWSSTSEE